MMMQFHWLAFIGLLTTATLSMAAELEITYSNPTPLTNGACFDLASTSGSIAILPEAVTATFIVDESALEKGFLERADVASATLSFGDANWSLADLSSFLFSSTEINQSFAGLSFTFDEINTPSTPSAVASGTETGLILSGILGLRGGVCEYRYDGFSFALLTTEDIGRDLTDNGLSSGADTIRQLADSGTIRSRDARLLETPLSSLYINLKRANVRRADVRLSQFERRVAVLERTGRLTPEVGAQLRTSADQTRRTLDSLRFDNYFVDLPESPACRAAPACGNPTLFVDDNATGAQLGTAADPFDSVGAALASAESNGWECVSISLAPGEYPEGRLSIRQDTVITGTSGFGVASVLTVGFENEGDHFFELADIIIDNSSREFAALTTKAEQSCTVVRDVIIFRAGDHGIYQSGGAITVDNAQIYNTTAAGSDLDSGYAVRLDNSASACLSDLSVANSRGGALLSDGPNTRVFANRLNVRGTVISAALRDKIDAVLLGEETGTGESEASGHSALPLYAAVHTRNQSLMLGENVNLFNNQIAGIGVSTGAQAHYQVASVNTTRLPGNLFEAISTYAAFAVGAETVLQLSAFDLRRSDLIGLFIGSTALATLDEGNIEDNPIGLSIRNDVYAMEAFEDCFTEVRYLDNTRNLDSASLPVPEGLEELFCANGVDDDNDGDPDCADFDCRGATECQAGYIPPSTPAPPPPRVVCPSVAYNPSWCALD